jgi:hypothetical protein
MMRGDPVEAERLLREAQALDAKLAEVFPMVRANVHRLDANLALAQHRKSDARTAFDRAITILAGLFPDSHPILAEVRLERFAALDRAPTPAEFEAIAGPLESGLVPHHPLRERLEALRSRR